MKNIKKLVLGVFAIASALGIVALIRKPKSTYKDELKEINPMQGERVEFVNDDSKPENSDGVRGYLKAIGRSHYEPAFYERSVKRIIDIVLSLCGLIVLSPVFFALSIAILIDDPGPIFFVQKRVGKDKEYFKLHKFRSMKVSTPRNVPTHMLENPDQYITRVGRFLRKTSLDELPQVWDIFIGNMSVIGPRPALWNQDLLVSERDKYNANDVRPGLTGWAQINGRDELEIVDKARLDGEYVSRISFLFDLRCFVGTIASVLRSDGVVEGGTNYMIDNTSRRKLN